MQIQFKFRRTQIIVCKTIRRREKNKFLIFCMDTLNLRKIIQLQIGKDYKVLLNVEKLKKLQFWLEDQVCI